MKKKRWIYGIVGVVVLLFAGLVYAWSVLAAPIKVFFPEWSSTQVSFTFTLCMMFFCFGGLVGGMLSEKISPKIILKISAILFILGFFLASRANEIIVLYIGYGVFAGMASGLAYNSILSNITKFFPDCPGLISGILLMGFGIGSFIIGKVYQIVTPSGEGIDVWRRSFMSFGFILFVIMFVCSFFIRRPSENELKEIKKGKKDIDKAKKVEGVGIKPASMIKMTSFWIFFIWATLLSSAGLAVVSQATGIAMEVGSNISLGTISTVVGLISIFNGIGRVIFGGLFDKIGRQKTMMLNNVLFLLAVIILMVALRSKEFILIIIGFCVIGIAYGGITPTNSAFVNDFYGSEYYPINLSLINMNLLIASFGSTISGLLYDISKSYFTTLVVMMIVIIIGALSSFMIKRKDEVV